MVNTVNDAPRNDPSADVAELKTRVASGQVVLDPEAGKQLQAALSDEVDRVSGWLDRVRGLARKAPFGSNVVAEAMAGKFQHRAEGDPDSFAATLDQYRKVLSDAHDAVSGAMQRYARTDESMADEFGRIERLGGLDGRR
jgi:hypothetical protein